MAGRRADVEPLTLVYRRRGEGIGRILQLLVFDLIVWVALSLASHGGTVLLVEVAVLFAASVGVAVRLLRAGTLLASSESVEIWRTFWHTKHAWSEVSEVRVVTKRTLGGTFVAVPTLVLRSGAVIPLELAAEPLRSPTDGERSDSLAHALDTIRIAAAT